MKRQEIDVFNKNSSVKKSLDPYLYAFALTGDDEKAKELVALIKHVKEMGFAFTIAYDDERELFNVCGLTK